MAFASGSILRSGKSPRAPRHSPKRAPRRWLRVLRPISRAVENAIAGFDAEIAALRAEGLTRNLSGDAIERLFGLGFAFDQLRQDLRELSRWMADCSQERAVD